MIDLTLLVERSERRRTTKPIKTRELSDAQLWIPLSSFVYSIFDIGSEDWWIRYLPKSLDSEGPCHGEIYSKEVQPSFFLHFFGGIFNEFSYALRNVVKKTIYKK